MACSTGFPAAQGADDAGSGDSHRNVQGQPERSRTGRNVHQQQRPPQPRPSGSTSRRMNEQRGAPGAASIPPAHQSPPFPTLAILLIVFDSPPSSSHSVYDRSRNNGILHLHPALPASSLPLSPPAVSLIPRAFLAHPGERPHQLEQFSSLRYANYLLSTSLVPSLERGEDVDKWTPLGPLGGLVDGTAYTSATVPPINLADDRTKTFLEQLCGDMPGGRLPFDPRRAYVLYLAPMERRYAPQTQPVPAQAPFPLPPVRYLLSSHHPPGPQAGPFYSASHPPSAYPQPSGQGIPQNPSSSYRSPSNYQEPVKQEEPEIGMSYPPSTPQTRPYPDATSLGRPSSARMQFPVPSAYPLSESHSPEDDPSPTHSSDTMSPSPQAPGYPVSSQRSAANRAASRTSPASTVGPSRSYAHRSPSDDPAFPHVAFYLTSRFPDVADVLHRRGDGAPTLNGPWWFEIHTSAFMHVCNTLNMPTMRETQFFHAQPTSVPPGAPWDGRITADDVARWFGSFPKSNAVARSTIRNHVGILRRWQTLWERAEMQYFRDRQLLSRPLPASGPERDTYLATELLGVLGFIFSKTTEERQNLLAQGMHPQALERCANRWPWGEVEEKIVKYFPEFGPRRRPRESHGAPSTST